MCQLCRLVKNSITVDHKLLDVEESFISVLFLGGMLC